MDEKQIDHIKAIIQSMTPAERNDPDSLNVSRKKRIAKGSGRSVQEASCTERPEPLAIRFLRDTFKLSGSLRSAGVID